MRELLGTLLPSSRVVAVCGFAKLERGAGRRLAGLLDQLCCPAMTRGKQLRRALLRRLTRPLQCEQRVPRLDVLAHRRRLRSKTMECLHPRIVPSVKAQPSQTHSGSARSVHVHLAETAYLRLYK
jgi:hypothetical protein